MSGKKHSLETRLKMSRTRKGRSLSLETRRKISEALSGERSPGWKGGRRKDSQGYIRIYQPDHPNANSKRCVYEHRLVVEKALGRYLKTDELVHHINGIKDDNHLENLQLVNHHRQEVCPRCGWPMGNIQAYLDHKEKGG